MNCPILLLLLVLDIMRNMIYFSNQSFNIPWVYIPVSMIRYTSFLNEACNFYANGVLMKSHVQVAASTTLFAIPLVTLCGGFIASLSRNIVS